MGNRHERRAQAARARRGARHEAADQERAKEIFRVGCSVAAVLRGLLRLPADVGTPTEPCFAVKSRACPRCQAWEACLREARDLEGRVAPDAADAPRPATGRFCAGCEAELEKIAAEVAGQGLGVVGRAALVELTEPRAILEVARSIQEAIDASPPPRVR